MTKAPTPNTFRLYQWACVVSGVVWAEYKLSSAGMLTAETTRGPLIVWATDTGEGEDLPTVQAPTLSALEEQTAKVNTRAAFERAIRAGGGRRRLRGITRKTWAAKPCRKAFVLTMRKLFEWVSVQGLIFDVWQAVDGDPKALRSAGVGVLRGKPADKTAKGKREARRFVEQERFEDRLRDIAPAWADEDNPNGWDEETLNLLEALSKGVRKLRSGEGFRYAHVKQYGVLEYFGEVLAYAAIRKDDDALRGLFCILKARRFFSFSALLKHLEAAAYRAHLAKRVKPVTRRTRAPRPLYARPRPPTAPTAPPLLEA